MFEYALSNSHSRQSCHPSRWLLVLKESLWYTFHMIKGNLPTNHVSSKYRMNSLIWGNCRAATLTVCQTGRTKRTGTNAQCSSYSKETVHILLNYSFPMDSAPPFPFPPPSPLCPSLLPHTHTIHQLSNSPSSSSHSWWAHWWSGESHGCNHLDSNWSFGHKV